MMKNSPRKTRLPKPALGLIAIALVLVAILVLRRSLPVQNVKTVHPVITTSPSPTTSNLISAGNTSVRGPGQTPAPSTQTTTPSPVEAIKLVKPIGQLLNKPKISLSAGANDAQHNGSMVSTIISAAPGSTNSIFAIGTGGAKISVGESIVADANGQGSEINWNAKTIGLTTGTWQIQVFSQRGDSAAQSDTEQLIVEN